MIGDNIIDIGFAQDKTEINSFGNVINRERKAEHRSIHAFEQIEFVPDTAFPPPEYFIEVLENASFAKLSLKSQKKLAGEIANLNVCIKCSSPK